jgi:hypothetical protein
LPTIWHWRIDQSYSGRTILGSAPISETATRLVKFLTGQLSQSADFSAHLFWSAEFHVCSFNNHRSATCDATLLLMKNYDLTPILNGLLVNVVPLLRGLSRDEFRFTINHETFPTSVVEAVALSSAVRE